MSRLFFACQGQRNMDDDKNWLASYKVLWFICKKCHIGSDAQKTQRISSPVTRAYHSVWSVSSRDFFCRHFGSHRIDQVNSTHAPGAPSDKWRSLERWPILEPHAGRKDNNNDDIKMNTYNFLDNPNRLRVNDQKMNLPKKKKTTIPQGTWISQSVDF